MLTPFEIPLEIVVPESLEIRDISFNYLVGLALFSSIMLLSLARAAQSDIYASMAVGLVKVFGVRAFLRESLPILGRASLFLLVNYLISGGLVVYLIANYLEFEALDAWILALLVPVLVFMGHLGSMFLTGWMIGAREVFRGPIAMKFLGVQLLGIVYFICALIWVLQPDLVEITIQVVFWAFIVESLFRVIKSISVVLGLGVSWYYIILYFCTLEILPLLICYYLIMQNIKG